LRKSAVWLALLAALTLAPWAGAQPPGQPLAFVFEEASVTVANAAAKGTVVLFGIGKEYESFYLTRHMWKEVLTDDDGDGAVHLAVPKGVPAQSVWIAVDLATGQSAVATPSLDGGKELVTPGLAGRRQGSVLQALRDERKQGYLILVKSLSAGGKEAGAWFLAAGDGNARDADGEEDGAIEVELASAEPLGPSTPPAPPEGISGTDRVYLIDPDTLEYYSALLPSLRSLSE